MRVSSGRSKAEKKVLDWLARLDDRWTVVHSLGVLNHPFKRWAEVDALIVGPPGVLVLEVKGGRVARRSGLWEFTDRTGRVTRQVEGPFDQAGSAHAAVRGFLKEQRVLRPGQCSGYGVAFPDVTFHGRPGDVIRDVLLDASSAWTAPDRVLARWCQYWTYRAGPSEGLTQADVDAIVDVLRADLDLRPSLSLLATEVEEELTRATREQLRVLAAGADNPHLVVAGRAGTGKTMLALAEARRLADEGRTVLLTCGSLPLARRLAEAASAEDAIHVRTYDSVGSLARRFDAVVVDEAQDLGGDWPGLLDGCLVGGVAQGIWRLFLDPAQDLGGAQSDPTTALPAGTTRMSLTLNCRNTRQIAVIASMLTRTELDAEAPVLGPDVVKHWWSAREEHDDLLAVEISRLASSLPAERIAVLSREPMAAERRDRLSTLSGVVLTRLDESRRGAAVVATAEEFKGLEAVAVVLADVESLDNPSDRRHFYVACTRARVQLTLLLHQSVRSAYEDGAAWFGNVITRRRTPRELQPF
jgi:hypothetical protein